MNDTNVPEVRNQLEKSQKTIELLKDNLIIAHNHMRQQVDQCRTEREFDLGDWVFVRLQPNKQVSLKSGGKHKLAPKFYGPYQIIQKISQVAYKLRYLIKVVSTMSSMYHVSKKCWVNIK